MKDLVIYIFKETHKSALNDLTKKKYAQFSVVLAPARFRRLMPSIVSTTPLALMHNSVIHGELIGEGESSWPCELPR